MEYVQYIDNESYDGGAAPRAFTSLEKLVLVELPNLESFLKEERMEMFPCLSELSIHDCPRLRLPCLPSVKRLTITGCTEELLQPISIRHNLTSLTLRDCVDLTSFPEGMMRNLSCLKTLTIDGFFKLKVLPIERINSIALEELEIQSCPELESFPEQFLEGLCSLRILLIYSCEKFRSLSEGFQHLTLLENLEICGCPNLVSLTDGLKHLNRLHKLTIIGGCCPQGIEHIPCLRSLQLDSLREVTSLPDSLGELTTLQRLSIGDCPKLTTLPTSLGELTTLQRLSIYRCPKLTTLPTSLGDLINLQRLSINWCPSLRTLPTSFQHLTNLHSVTIDDCPKLVKRCKDETWDVVRTWNQSMTPEYSKRGVWGQSAVGWNREGKRK
ncbi:hypothetical protein L6164_008906 [Bauhinia variegata]|nr:hypothetical protein L6164_008906 [Bauhinia variegata]